MNQGIYGPNQQFATMPRGLLGRPTPVPVVNRIGQGVLDSFPNAAAAYSLRLLRDAYSGPVVRVRRSSDNAELDFVASEITNGTLASWVGPNRNGLVRTLYDQSGNNRHLEQETADRQPRLVNSGRVEQLGSRPAIVADGSDDFLRVNGTVYPRGPTETIIAAFSATSLGGISTLWSLDVDGPGGSSIGFAMLRTDASNTLNFATAAQNAAITAAAGVPYIAFAHGGVVRGNALAVNGGTPAVTSAASGIAQGVGSAMFREETNAGQFGRNWNGRCCEFIVWDRDLFSSRGAIESAVNLHYGFF